jgi:hypothetical protein
VGQPVGNGAVPRAFGYDELVADEPSHALSCLRERGVVPLVRPLFSLPFPTVGAVMLAVLLPPASLILPHARAADSLPVRFRGDV